MAGGDNSQAQPEPRSQTQDRGASRGYRGGRGGRGRRQGNPASRDSDSPTSQGGASQEPTAPAQPSSSRHGRRNRRGGQRWRGRDSTSSTPRAPNPRRAFGGHLTANEEASEETSSPSVPPSLSADAPAFVPGKTVTVRSKPKSTSRAAEKERPPRSTSADLGTRIHEDISNGNYECIICTENVRRSSKVYSCTRCHTVLHLSCVQQWYKPQIQKEEFDGSWRCPGCNSMVQDVPVYHCWCGKEHSPKPASKSLPPHSCGQTCSKPRPTCPHPCPLQCHAGPCPPCDAMGPTQSCFCGKHDVRKPCRETDYQNGWSCHEVCGDLLPCGYHICARPCHAGLCGACDLLLDVKCYCGRVEKRMPCYLQDEVQQSYNIAYKSWFEASFSCSQPCGRNFDCGKHICSQPCHPQDECPGHCPFAPDVVTHCPCGKTPLEELLCSPRQSCEDPIPHCQKSCAKELPCGHRCIARCHVGDCPTCVEHMEIFCQCGRTTADTLCHQGDIQHPQCLRVCQATLNCGRHKCGEHCCSGEKKATARLAAQRKKRGPVPEWEAEHICIKTCGKLLKCEKHNCVEMCHRGICPSCPEAIFEEVSCSCGRTVLHPPQPCGTRPPECRFQCPRVPSCDHPHIDHHCHPDDVECPKCPFLVDRICVCGKDTISFHPCHLQEARCGKVCGKKLECGHTCKKSCHRPGECSGETSPSKTCGQVCGKPKLLCDHPCQSYCHGRSPCDESLPCQAKVTISCPCGQHKKEVKCLTSSANPSPSYPRMECDDECLRLERNRRLAEALNIDPNSELSDHVPYSDMTLKLFKELGTWAENKEREFRVFAQTRDEQRIRFAPMSSGKRQFLHVLAEDFRLESHSEDREPHRHVIVAKQMLFVSAPAKTLAQCVKIRERQAAEQAAKDAAAKKVEPQAAPAEPFNALLLTSPSFGLTIDDLHRAFDEVLSNQSGFLYNIDFIPGDEVLIRATANYAAYLSSSGIEQSLSALKSQLSEVIKSKKLAGGIVLVHANSHNEVSRRERPSKPDPTGWNAVAGRAAKKASAGPEETAARSTGRRMLGLKKKTAEKGPEKAWGVLDEDIEC